MTRRTILALLATVAVTTTLLAAPTIKEIMTKAHKAGTGILANLGADLKADLPDWPDVQKQTRELVMLATDLSKAAPSKGDKASWDRLTKAYLDTARALDDAAQKKDQRSAQAAHVKLNGSCKTCHDAHRAK